jgi:hypothetical protein
MQIENLKDSDLISIHHIFRIIKIENNDGKTVLTVENVYNGFQQTIDENIVYKSLHSTSDHFIKMIKINTHEAVETLLKNSDMIFTASFVKSDGTERLIRGRYLYIDQVMGRLVVEDLDLAHTNNCIRQIDCRTIKYLIINNTKYEISE